MSELPPSTSNLPFVLVTGNPDKRLEAERILGRVLETVDVDLAEVQSNDLIEVLRFKGEEAWRHVGRPLVVEETGLEMSALNGFPGPLIKWMLAKVGAEGVARTAAALGDDRVVARCGFLYRDDAGVLVAQGESPGRLVLPPRGDTGFGWDPVFVPDGEVLTCAELGDEVKDRIGHRGRGWRALLETLARERDLAVSPP